MRAKIPNISIFQGHKDGLSFFASLIDALVGAALEALGGYIGNRSSSPSENDYGHIRVGITIARALKIMLRISNHRFPLSRLRKTLPPINANLDYTLTYLSEGC